MWFADIVQKLIDKDKHILAVKYILEFNLADRISPVPILKACVDEAKKLGKRLFQEGKSLVSVTLINKPNEWCPKPYIYLGIFAE